MLDGNYLLNWDFVTLLFKIVFGWWLQMVIV